MSRSSISEAQVHPSCFLHLRPPSQICFLVCLSIIRPLYIALWTFDVLVAFLPNCLYFGLQALFPQSAVLKIWTGSHALGSTISGEPVERNQDNRNQLQSQRIPSSISTSKNRNSIFPLACAPLQPEALHTQRLKLGIFEATRSTLPLLTTLEPLNEDTWDYGRPVRSL